MGKSYMTERVLALEYEVLTHRVDRTYGRAMRDAGIADARMREQSVALRDGTIGDEARDAFFRSYDDHIAHVLRRAARFRLPAVLDGYTLMLPDEVERVARLAAEVLGDNVRVLRLFVRRPYEQWLTNVVERAVWKNKSQIATSALTRSAYERILQAPPSVDGVEDQVVTSVQQLRDLVEEAGFQQHRWYQGFKVGPIEIKGTTDANEKVEALDPSDIVGRSVADLCCCTGVTSILMKIQGAESVQGVELKASRVAKAYEITKTLREQLGIEAKVQVKRGDAIAALDDMHVDTVAMFGALHYFEDYEGLIAKMGRAAGRAVYLEVLLSDDGKGELNGAPPQSPAPTPFTRKHGTTIYVCDTPALKRITELALSDFDLVSRVPVAGHGKIGADSYREVWGFRRRGLEDAPAAGVSG